MATSAVRVSTESLANDFVSALFNEYKGSRHVRRVASWIGFVVKGVEKVTHGDLRREQKWQIAFTYRERQFKVKYNHKIGSGFSRGGVQIVEVLSGRGAPEGDVVVQVTSLAEAEDCYLGLKWLLDSFIRQNPA